MKRGVEKLKQAWNDNPLGVIIVASFAATAAAKLLDASTERSRARVWEIEVARRDRITPRR